MFMVDITTYFDNDAGKANGLYTPWLMSGWIDFVLDAQNDAVKWVDASLAIAQNWVIDIINQYLSPIVLQQLIFTEVYTVIFKWVQTDIIANI